VSIHPYIEHSMLGTQWFLGVTMSVDLEDALTRTVDWHHGRRTSTHVDN